MKRKSARNVPNIVFLIFVSGLLIWTGCEEKITPPESMRLNLNVTVLDTTGFSFDHFNNIYVDSARVFTNSISYYNFYDTLSDSLGIASFEAILPDRYNISVSKRVAVNINGVNREYILNGQVQYVEILGDEFTTNVYVYPTVPGQLLLSEIYYNGSPPQSPYYIPQYFHDQFTEIYNNSDEVVYLDSLIIADLDYGHADEDYIYSIHAYMFPGSGKDYPLNPGEFVIIAQDAIDHTVVVPSSVDLHDADFEYFVSNPPGDQNNPDVTDMIQIHHKYGVDFLYSVFNDAVVLLKVTDPYVCGYSEFDCLKFPKSAVLDGVDYRDNLAEVEYKRLDSSIDAGLTGGFDSYKNKSIQRRIDFYKGVRPILMDNNNSSIDFIVLDHPTPGYIFDQGK